MSPVATTAFITTNIFSTSCSASFLYMYSLNNFVSLFEPIVQFGSRYEGLSIEQAFLIYMEDVQEQPRIYMNDLMWTFAQTILSSLGSEFDGYIKVFNFNIDSETGFLTFRAEARLEINDYVRVYKWDYRNVSIKRTPPFLASGMNTFLTFEDNRMWKANLDITTYLRSEDNFLTVLNHTDIKLDNNNKTYQFYGSSLAITIAAGDYLPLIEVPNFTISSIFLSDCIWASI